MSKQSDWIGSIAPYAKEASLQTGMSAELMLAQAAQETGWGQKVLPGTNNLFNIKADSSWTGETKTFQVPEYVNGKWVTVDATFRSYPTVQDAFVDRVNFLKSNPRYAKSGLFDEGTLGNPAAEALALQKAGYATDPEYASNLMKVASGPTMQAALHSDGHSVVDLPNGDTIDAVLPDGTRVVSTSATVNGQTTITADLVDKDGHVLLHAGAGQTMERDPETGIVQIRTGTCEQVQQYDPATGEVTNELRNGSDAARVYESLLDVFQNPQVPADAGVQIADASGSTQASAATSNTNSTVPQSTNPTLQGAAASVGLFNAISNIQNWNHMSDLGKLSALAGLHNALASVGTDLPGDFSGAAGWLSFAQGIQSGNVSMTVAGLNSMSDQALDGALNSVLGSSGIPYVGVALALNNFESNPAQSMGTLGGMAIAGPLGGAIGGFVGGALGGMFGNDAPPPPAGAAHFSWDADGNIQHTVDYNVSGGGDAANNIAASVQGMLQNLVDAHNARNESTADDIAINPYGLPRVSFKADAGGATMEVDLGNGQVASQSVNSPQFGEWLLKVVQDTGGLAPAWQVQTLQMHAQQMRSEGADEAQVGHAVRSVQGDAVESGDFKNQTFGALVVHLHDDANVQAAQAKLSDVLRDIDNDGYLEKTQWISATDAQGNLQGLLALDLDGNGQIETRDILNVGGNKGQDNHTELQRNNVQWLDANGDGSIDKSDPAFAAIKLWVDVNQDGKMQSGESQSLASQSISRINFKTAEVTYEDGHTDALTASALQGDTEGAKLTQIQVADATGVLHALNAGVVLEHEGYQGQVQITDEGGTRWVSKREQAYEQQALRTGDWEGTTEQEAHRHGGGNVEGAPTETTATGASDFGPVQTQANVTTQSTLEVGDARVVSDVLVQAPQPQAMVQTTIAAGDSRIKSNTAPVNNTANNAPRASAEGRMAFVPQGQASVQNEIQAVTASMIESSQSTLFGAGVNAGLGVLTVVGFGAVQTAQATEQRAIVVSDVAAAPSLNMATPSLVSHSNTFSSTPTLTSTDAGLPAVTFRQVELGVFNVPSLVQAATVALPSGATNTTLGDFQAITAAVAVNTPAFAVAEQKAAPTAVAAPLVSAANLLSLGLPVVQGEVLPGTEDVVLRLSASMLLANDSSPNALADPSQAVLNLTAVSEPLHGQVSLVDGEVVFAPDANFHGTASFTYTVTDQFGLSSKGTVSLEIAGVNDVPVVQGERVSSDEDVGLIFTQAQLLANDSDVDVLTDDQVLVVSRVAQAQHGTVWLDAQGQVRFVPEANYHGPAQFTYWVIDGAGAEVSATMNLTIAAVNDIPVTQGESTNTQEDTTLYIDAATLLANDRDVDTLTDGQVLSIIAVKNTTHCIASLMTQSDGSQRIMFVPDENFHGAATFDYVVSDGNGGTALATAVVNLSAVNDAPVTTGEKVVSDEDIALIFTSQDLLSNDSDVDVVTDAQVLTISRVESATHGTVTLDAQGQVHFTPEANYHGPAQFTYWVSDGLATDGAGAEVSATVMLTILAVNDLPVVTDEAVSTNEDTTLLFDPAVLLTNDTDVDVATDAQVLSVSAVGNATHGTVVFVSQPDGSERIAFTPEANYFGVASYQYTVSDGNGGNTVGTVVVNLAQINDAPVAQADSISSTDEDTALHISFASLLGNDTDADSHNAQWGGTDDVLTVSAVGNATHGAVALVVLADGEHEVVFTPDVNYHGSASFAYEVSDSSGALSQAMATFTVTAVNDLPEAVAEEISSNEDTILVINQAALLQNDTDVDTTTDGQVLSITSVANGQHGSVTLNADSTINFVPEANFYGNASFDYTVDDGNGGTVTATATVTLANVNDAPVASGETINSNEDQVLTITASTLLQNDSDIDNAHSDLKISRVQSGAGGTVSLNASGQVVFTPTANYNGDATFTYWAKDTGNLESNAVTATVTLAAVNDAPNAQGEIVSGASEDAVFHMASATLLANDHDIDDSDGALSLSWVGNASGGSVSLDGGNVVFTPSSNFNGNATFQYKVSDAAGLESAPVQAVIPVAAVNDIPVAVDDQFATYTNSIMTVAFNQLTGNDTDVDHDALTVSTVRDRANGHASLVNGEVQFVANSGFVGSASFDYLTDDSHGGQSWATAYVDVKTPPNQYPTMGVSQESPHSAESWHGGQVSYSAGNYLDKLVVQFSATDDGPGPLSIELISANKYSFYGLNASMVSPSWWGWYDGVNGVKLDMTNNLMTFSISDSSEKGFNQYQTVWKITDEKGVSNIWHYNVDSYSDYQLTSSSYNEHSGYYTPPVILDLNGDGVHFTSIQNSNITLDVNFDGIQDKMAWAGNDDGVLVWDKDQNHQITDVSEVSFQTLKPGAQTDLEGLQALDTNSNDLLDVGDASFSEFAVWQDANGNGNGVADAGEFKTLTELGIASINLKSDGQVRDAGTLLANGSSGETDAMVMGNAAFTRTDGSAGLVADTMLAYEVGQVPPAISNEMTVNAPIKSLAVIEEPLAIHVSSATQTVDTSVSDEQTAEVMRQALLFNQVCSITVIPQSAPLVAIPIQADVALHDMLLTAQDGSNRLMQAA